MHLMALAIGRAGATDGPKIRQAMYDIEKYEGLIKTYEKPFAPDKHDALSASDYIFTHFKDGEILPLTN